MDTYKSTEEAGISIDMSNSAPLLKDRYEKICTKFKENAQDNEELDVYQVAAFMKYYHPNDRWSSLKYCLFLFKMLIVALLQTVGMVAFLWFVVTDNFKESGKIKVECSTHANPALRIVATLFSFYISLYIIGLLQEQRREGLYEHAAYLPKFLANEWVYLGLYCNFFTLLAATWGSFLLIYTAETTLDIVLNSVALYFIVEIDNLLVTHFDSERIADWMENEFEFRDWFDDDWYNETEGNVRFRRVCCMTLQISGRTGGCNRLKLIWVFFGGIFTYFALAVGVFGCIIAPIAIAICY
eukprot:280810_1